MLRVIAFVVTLLAAVPGCVSARETGFLDRTVSLAGVEYRYQVYVPRDFDPARRWPVILALHGGGEYGSDGLRPAGGALARSIRLHPDRYPAIVIFAQAHADGTPGWQRQGGEAALAAVDQALAEFSGDPARVYLTGFSAGGNGAWSLAYRNPKRFAAVVVVCGFTNAFTGRTSGVVYPPIAPPSQGDPYLAIARRVAGLPIWLFHGDADQSVPVDESRRMSAALRTVAADVHYTELPGVGHNAWDSAYEDPAMAAWLFTQRRR
ncbi:prolyl oligopeptidase family serine peptidase [Phenylobacterium sp.]|jgi:predicted peptidase|uniref:carboxylesterase family protein n=1 Tax=Phenylobacterium sp. TaxID=1871053 RepID=UPI002F3F547D